MKTIYAFNGLYNLWFQTYIGMMLVAVNPYKDLGLYTKLQMKKYSYCRQYQELPAHIYAVGNQCFYEMKQKAQRQCILIRYCVRIGLFVQCLQNQLLLPAIVMAFFFYIFLLLFIRRETVEIIPILGFWYYETHIIIM